jgi:hypothetical protein
LRDLARALVGDLGGLTPSSWMSSTPPPPLPSGLRFGLIICYYALVLGGLLALYGVKPPNPPPFIYQGF